MDKFIYLVVNSREAGGEQMSVRQRKASCTPVTLPNYNTQKDFFFFLQVLGVVMHTCNPIYQKAEAGG